MVLDECGLLVGRPNPHPGLVDDAEWVGLLDDEVVSRCGPLPLPKERLLETGPCKTELN